MFLSIGFVSTITHLYNSIVSFVSHYSSTAFLSRPLGGLVIGYIGDKQGRKQALVLSLFLMAFPTFLMGCLPTYQQIGSWSTTLLLGCRILQGMSVGGQLPASLIYTVETKPKERWGYYGSLVMVRRSLSFVALVRKVIGIQLTEFAVYRWHRT